MVTVLGSVGPNHNKLLSIKPVVFPIKSRKKECIHETVHIYVRLICINIFDGRDNQNKDFENCVSKKVEKRVP